MGIITWQNVPTGDLSAGQDGLRSASQMLDRAAQGASTAATAYQVIQDAQKKAAQDAADKTIALEMFKAKDAEQAKQMLAAGVVDPRTAQAASVDALLRAGKQVDVLQGQAVTAQSMAATDQKMAKYAYDASREQQGHQLSDAAMPMFNAALKVAVYDRRKALQMIEGSDMHQDDKIKAVASLNSVSQSDEAIQWAKLNQEKKVDTDAEAVAQYTEAMVRASGDPQAQADLYKQIQSTSGYAIADKVRKGTEARDPTHATEISGPQATMGVNSATGKTEVISPTGVAYSVDDDEKTVKLNKQLDTVLSVKPVLSPEAKTLKEAEAYKDKALDTVVEDLVKTHTVLFPKGSNGGELTQAVKAFRKDLPKGHDISDGEIAKIIVTNVDSDGMFTWADLNSETNVHYGDIRKQLAATTQHRKELKGYENFASRQTQLKSLYDQRREAEKSLAQATANVNAGRGSDAVVNKHADTIDRINKTLEKNMRSVEEAQKAELAQQAKERAEREAERAKTPEETPDQVKFREMIKRTGF